jgi:hypothetical protein
LRALKVVVPAALVAAVEVSAEGLVPEVLEAEGLVAQVVVEASARL